MPVHRVTLLLATLLLSACAAGAAGSTDLGSAPSVEPPGAVEAALDSPGSHDVSDVDTSAAPYELVLTADLRSVAPGEDDPVIEVRQVVVGDRHRVTTTGPGDRVLEEHVVTPDAHWMRVPPQARGALAGAEWVHVDLALVEEVGDLPERIAAARTLMPAPGDLSVGDRIGTREVLAVEVIDGDAVRITLSDLPVPMELRRRPLPGGTEIDPPADARDVRELRGLLGTLMDP